MLPDPLLQKKLKRRIRTWFRLWGLSGLEKDLQICFTNRTRRCVAQFEPNRPQIRLSTELLKHPQEFLLQALCHEGAHAAVFAIHSKSVRPHGAESHLSETPTSARARSQAVWKSRHLENFAPREFDYIIVDEFHHASAKTYRRLIEYFEPSFLLGLTATPERTDGGDLLSLCGENLVYRCDLVRGIEHGLLSPFRYFGVPDEVDYKNIPWRSSRFDEVCSVGVPSAP